MLNKTRAWAVKNAGGVAVKPEFKDLSERKIRRILREERGAYF